MLDAKELERYARHIVLREVGGPGQAKLKAARVLVIGAGGLGAPVLLYLAAAGCGAIGVVDDDTVSLSNLQRQVIYSNRRYRHPQGGRRRGGDRAAQSACADRDAHDAARCQQRARPDRAIRHRRRRLRQFRHALSRLRRLLFRQEAAGHRRGRHLRRLADHAARARAARRRHAQSDLPVPLSRSRRRPAPCRPARKPAFSARCRACSAR